MLRTLMLNEQWTLLNAKLFQIPLEVVREGVRERVERERAEERWRSKRERREHELKSLREAF